MKGHNNEELYGQIYSTDYGANSDSDGIGITGM